MASSSVKTTYALDLETVRTLDELARRWGVSKSEALRRAIRASANQSLAVTPPEPVRALGRLPSALGLSPRAAERWAASGRAERRARHLR